MKITIQKIQPYHSGDWHDPMLKWEVTDGKLKQHFSTKKEALSYAKYWRKYGFETGSKKWLDETL